MTKRILLSVAAIAAAFAGTLVLNQQAFAQVVKPALRLDKYRLQIQPKVSQPYTTKFTKYRDHIYAIQSLNMKVLAYARSKMGVQVGNGECWTLVNEALRSAGAQQPGTNGLSTYQFGNSVALSNVIPGDILQFENVKFVAPNGAWNSFPHHTAIVNQKSGNRIELIHQNVNGNRTVTTGWIDLGHLQPGGSILAYRPR